MLRTALEGTHRELKNGRAHVHSSMPGRCESDQASVPTGRKQHTSPGCIVCSQRLAVGCCSNKQRRSRKGPACVTSAMRDSLRAINLRYVASIRVMSSCSLSPPGGARFHGSSAQGSLSARDTASHRKPSHVPKLSSRSSSITCSSQQSRRDRAAASSKHLCEGLVKTTSMGGVRRNVSAISIPAVVGKGTSRCP